MIKAFHDHRYTGCKFWLSLDPLDVGTQIMRFSTCGVFLYFMSNYAEEIVLEWSRDALDKHDGFEECFAMGKGFYLGIS